MIHQVHTVRIHEKKVRGKCTCVQVTLFTLIRWNRPVRGLPSKGQTSCSCQKTQILDQIFFVVNRKVSVFFWLVWDWKYPLFTGGKYCFYNLHTVPRFPKKGFPAVSELCKDTSMTHCTIPWKKRSGESAVWGLTAIPVVSLNKRNYTVWVPSKK